MKFFLYFMGCFILGSLAITMFSGSMEMLAFVVFFNVTYLLVAFFSWIPINFIIKSFNLLYAIAKCLLGLAIVNGMVYLFADTFPTLILLGIGNGEGKWIVSFFLHIIYFASFVIAVVRVRRKNTVI